MPSVRKRLFNFKKYFTNPREFAIINKHLKIVPVAQLAERYLDMVEVISSSLVGNTILDFKTTRDSRFFLFTDCHRRIKNEKTRGNHACLQDCGFHGFSYREKLKQALQNACSGGCRDTPKD